VAAMMLEIMLAFDWLQLRELSLAVSRLRMS
jgi:hypothetical protein